jgi:hypothetical protein
MTNCNPENGLPFCQFYFKTLKTYIHWVLWCSSWCKYMSLKVSPHVGHLYYVGCYNLSKENRIYLWNQPVLQWQSVSERCDDSNNNCSVDLWHKPRNEGERLLTATCRKAIRDLPNEKVQSSNTTTSVACSRSDGTQGSPRFWQAPGREGWMLLTKTSRHFRSPLNPV